MLGPDQIIACPKCSALAKHFTMMSGNTFGAVLWTDGKFEAHMMPQLPQIVKCTACHEYYWLSQAKEIGSFPWEGRTKNPKYPDSWRNAPKIKALSASEYLEALETNVAADENQLRYLRVSAWHAANDQYRDEQCRKGISEDPRLAPSFSAQAKENLQKLYTAIVPDNDADVIMKAEAARELGLFDDTLKLLEYDFSEKAHCHIAAFISELARKSIGMVRIVPEVE